ncbi:hypothetical protein [Paraeggerthella sp.]|uniref:hypothetical protein n=1 Tax=Paraeggerthella sp. TaxID=2897350 RepID=UPI0035277634
MASIEPPTPERFLVVYQFMWQKLGLDGVALRVFARIYGFCKDGKTEFYESRPATAKFLGTTPRSVTRSINELVEKGLIEQVGVRTSASGNVTRSYRLANLKHIEPPLPDQPSPHDKPSPPDDVSPQEAFNPDGSSGAPVTIRHPKEKGKHSS